METMEFLLKERTAKSKALSAVVNKIQKLESEKGLPELEKKYLGRYFKKKERYSSGKSWWTYTHVISVQFPNSCKVNSFETMSDGKRMFTYEGFDYLSCIGKEIKKEEFDYHKDMVLSFLKEKI